MRTSIRRRSGPAVAATHSGRRMIQGCAGVIVFLLALAAPLHAQLPATPEARAAAVERGLQPPILVEGATPGSRASRIGWRSSASLPSVSP